MELQDWLPALEFLKLKTLLAKVTEVRKVVKSEVTKVLAAASSKGGKIIFQNEIQAHSQDHISLDRPQMEEIPQKLIGGMDTNRGSTGQAGNKRQMPLYTGIS